MKYLYPIIFIVALVLNFVLIIYLSFNYVYSISSPLISDFIQLFPTYHFGIFHNFFNAFTHNGIIANQWALSIGIALTFIGIFLIAKNFFFKTTQKWMYFLPIIGLAIGYLLSQQQGLERV